MSEKHALDAYIWKRRDEWVLELSGTINDCAFICRHVEPESTAPEAVAGLPSLYAENESLGKELVDAFMQVDARTEEAFLKGEEVDRLTARVMELEAGLEKIRNCTSEHGGASKALKIISALLPSESGEKKKEPTND